MECVCFTLIVDDIVLPQGETVMEVLGGGGGFPYVLCFHVGFLFHCRIYRCRRSGPQTLFGYQLVTNQNAAVGLSGRSMRGEYSSALVCVVSGLDTA